MQTLGVWLRQAREARGVTLKDAEEATRIRVRFLDALEVGDLAAFPSGDVQIRGFLRIYARYLGLPADEVLARYNVEGRVAGAAPSDAPVDTKPAPSRSRSTTRPATASFSTPTSRPRWMRAETLLIACIVLILLLVVAAGGWYFVDRRWGGEEAAATATTTGSASSSTPATTSISPLVTPTFPANLEGDVTLALEAVEHVWVRVTVDGVLAFEGMLAPEQAESWSGQEMVIVDTGNGAGLQVTVNEQLQGPLCGRNETCSRGWGTGGEIVVPAIAPTATP